MAGEKEVKQARLYISGLGLFVAELNGQPVGDEALTPYYSSYHEKVQYLTYDVTAQLQADNMFCVSLGNGWYKGRFGLGNQSNNFGDRFAMIAEIHLQYTDGSEDVIATDKTWKYKGSDIEDDGIYDGEIINHLLWKDRENPWKMAVETAVEGQLVPRYSVPVCEMEDLPVREVIHTPAGETVLDFGQNFSGYVTFAADELPEGTRIVLDHGEILQNGNFYNENYRSAKAQFVYVADGRKKNVCPHFTCFGFRYVQRILWERSYIPVWNRPERSIPV